MTIKSHAELEAKIKKEFGLEFGQINWLIVGNRSLWYDDEECDYFLDSFHTKDISKAYQIIKSAYELEQAKNKLNELLEEV